MPRKRLPSSVYAGLTHKLKRGVGKQNILTLASLFLKDWMPHVVSILETIFQRKLSVSDKMTVRRGGSHVTCFLFLCKSPVRVELVRNGAHRQRVIDVTSKSGEMFKLDFSNEPAIKTVNGKITSKIENCLQEKSPVKKCWRHFYWSYGQASR